MEASNPLELNRHDLSSIEQYRVQRQTSVLVILFTDIKGFTEISERRGDQHAVELLRHHDEIVVRAIEEGGAGLVVKHIGDSVMAVFAEPSTAVERALRIQEETVAFNESHPELETLGIRTRAVPLWMKDEATATALAAAALGLAQELRR